MVGQANGAFRVELRRYQARGRMHFAPAEAPSIPADLAPLVTHIGGLDDFTFEPPRGMRPMTDLVDGTHALSPGDLRAIYGYYRTEQTWTGLGQTIAISGQSAINLADVRQFRSLFQLPQNDPETILVGDDPGIDTIGGAFQEGGGRRGVGRGDGRQRAHRLCVRAGRHRRRARGHWPQSRAHL
jgi:hypothetical protein